jgi:uncharacterized protein YcfL
VKKFLICKTCLIVFATLLLVGCGETIKTAVKKSDEFIYDNADKVARKDEVTGKREINLTSVEQELKNPKNLTPVTLEVFSDKAQCQIPFYEKD